MRRRIPRRFPDAFAALALWMMLSGAAPIMLITQLSQARIDINTTFRGAELLVLRSHGLSYEELAEALELNPTSIGTYLSRAQDAFRKEYIKRYGAE